MRKAARYVKRLSELRHDASRQEILRGVLRRLDERLTPDLMRASLRPDDIRDPGLVQLPAPATRPDRSRKLRIAWVTTPPDKGSGGHTTMFRMVQALEAAGHECVLALHNPHDSDLSERTQIIREGWPGITADVASLPVGLDGADAAIATAWQTAHALAKHGTAPMRRLYFVQDYEPLFYPRGSEGALAELSYRFGYRTIALGDMVAGHLRRDIGLDPDVLPFGCDTDVYHFSDVPDRSGVVFYTVPGAARRGYLLNLLALDQFHREQPDQPIHAYGGTLQTRLPFPVVWHGRVAPNELNALYNRSIAGLAMSFTNISLVAEEMLAAGCIPVVNDSADARSDLPYPHVAWTSPTPQAIAARLSALVSAPGLQTRAGAAAASVRHGWGPAQAGFLRIIEDEVYGAQV
jgi:glycosyltransferase involved in cell wall biosynthesis